MYYDIPNFSNYRIDTDGNVYSMFYDRMLKQSFDENTQRYAVRLKSDDGTYHKKYVHRLLAELLVPNPHGYNMVRLKDGDSKNLSLDNIEWITRTQLHTDLNEQDGYYTNKLQVRATLISPDGVEYTVHGVKTFCKEHDLDPATLRHLIRGTRNLTQHKGWTLKK